MNGITIRLRGVARKIPAFRALQRFLYSRRDYEGKFHEALRTAVRPGDTVWDVGANVGHYTELLSQWVGDQGKVIAFEPMPESAHKIEERVRGCANVVVDQTALSGEDGVAQFAFSSNSTTNHLVMGEAATGTKTLEVRMAKADTIAAQYGVIPDVIKLDVEGFEDDVLAGMSSVLAATKLRCILIEVHFRMLEERGRRDAPLQIESELKQHGLKTKWLDASHIQGTR